jgi:hypothetical protein
VERIDLTHNTVSFCAVVNMAMNRRSPVLTAMLMDIQNFYEDTVSFGNYLNHSTWRHIPQELKLHGNEILRP